MRPSAKRAFRMTCAALACCCLGSCTHWPLYTITTKEIPAFNEEPAQRIPLRAGFFTQFDKPTQYAGSAAIFCESEGLLMVDFDARAAFERATRRIFKEVVPLTAKETIKDWKAKNLDVVVTTGPASCIPGSVREGLLGRALTMTLSAEWFIISVDGTPVTSMVVKGEGRVRLGHASKSAKDALAKALDAHARRLYDDVATTAWWRDPSWKPK